MRPGVLEAEVLEVLWAADAHLTPREVTDRLPRELAYTTVLTTLRRLWDKGVAEREVAPRGYMYRAVVDRPSLAARRMREAMQTAPDSTAVLARFVGSLRPGEEAALRDILRETEL